nr:MAG TPA: hypothetical protein [Caudoviricetes sp.]
MLIISPNSPARGKIPKNASPKRARTAGKGKRGATLEILGNMTAPGCSRSFAGR